MYLVYQTVHQPSTWQPRPSTRRSRHRARWRSGSRSVPTWPGFPPGCVPLAAQSRPRARRSTSTSSTNTASRQGLPSWRPPPLWLGTPEHCVCAGRCSVCPSSSRTTSTSPPRRPPPPAQPSPTWPSATPTSCGGSSMPARCGWRRPTSTSSPPVSWARARPSEHRPAWPPPTASAAARARAPPWRWRAATWRSPSAPTRPVRGACRRPSTASWV